MWFLLGALLLLSTGSLIGWVARFPDGRNPAELVPVLRGHQVARVLLGLVAVGLVMVEKGGPSPSWPAAVPYAMGALGVVLWRYPSARELRSLGSSLEAFRNTLMGEAWVGLSGLCLLAWVAPERAPAALAAACLLLWSALPLLATLEVLLATRTGHQNRCRRRVLGAPCRILAVTLCLAAPIFIGTGLVDPWVLAGSVAVLVVAGSPWRRPDGTKSAATRLLTPRQQLAVLLLSISDRARVVRHLKACEVADVACLPALHGSARSRAQERFWETVNARTDLLIPTDAEELGTLAHQAPDKVAEPLSRWLERAHPWSKFPDEEAPSPVTGLTAVQEAAVVAGAFPRSLRHVLAHQLGEEARLKLERELDAVGPRAVESRKPVLREFSVHCGWEPCPEKLEWKIASKPYEVASALRRIYLSLEEDLNWLDPREQAAVVLLTLPAPARDRVISRLPPHLAKVAQQARLRVQGTLGRGPISRRVRLQVVERFGRELRWLPSQERLDALARRNPGRLAAVLRAVFLDPKAVPVEVQEPALPDPIYPALPLWRRALPLALPGAACLMVGLVL